MAKPLAPFSPFNTVIVSELIPNSCPAANRWTKGLGKLGVPGLLEKVSKMRSQKNSDFSDL